MKQLTHGQTTLGPFASVAWADDRWIADGAHILCLPESASIEDWAGPQVQPISQEALAELKAVKNAEINAARLKANRGTFTHAGKVFACDELSRGDIDGINGYVALVGALPPGWPGAWKAVDNTYAPIPDVPAWGAFYASMVMAGNANFAKAQALKGRLDEATTPEAISAIQW